MSAPQSAYEAWQCVLTWTTSNGHLDPLDLQQIVEALHGHSCGSLPGSDITSIAYDGLKLDITLKEHAR